LRFVRTYNKLYAGPHDVTSYKQYTYIMYCLDFRTWQRSVPPSHKYDTGTNNIIMIRIQWESSNGRKSCRTVTLGRNVSVQLPYNLNIILYVTHAHKTITIKLKMHDLCGRAGRHVKIRPRNENTHILLVLYDIHTDNICIYIL